MSISTALKSFVKKIPPIRALISELAKLRLKVAASGQRFLRGSINSSLINEKLNLIEVAFAMHKAASFADLGAIGVVNGGYTFYVLDKYRPINAVLVDTRPTDFLMKQSKKHPQLRILRGNFGDKHIAQEVGPIDMIFLFDVLLHQASPDWDELLEIYANQTQCMVIFNPQWIKTESTTRLLDLGEKEYFRNVPVNKEKGAYNRLFEKLDEMAPEYDKKWRDIHHIWQWGITDTDLIEKIKSLGFRMQYYRNYGKFVNTDGFENHAFVFSK